MSSAQFQSQSQQKQQQGLESSNASVCKICFEDGQKKHKKGDLIEPCLCSGSCSYIHEECLKDWIRAKKQNMRHPACEICLHPYRCEMRVGMTMNVKKAFREQRSSSIRTTLIVILTVLVFSALFAFVADIIVTGVTGESFLTDKQSFRVVAIFLLATFSYGFCVAAKQSCKNNCYFEEIVSWKLFSREASQVKQSEQKRKVSKTVHPVRLPAGPISTKHLLGQSFDVSIANQTTMIQQDQSNSQTIQLGQDQQLQELEEQSHRIDQSREKNRKEIDIESNRHECNGKQDRIEENPDDEGPVVELEEVEWRRQYSMQYQQDTAPTMTLMNMNVSTSLLNMVKLFGYSNQHPQDVSQQFEHQRKESEVSDGVQMEQLYFKKDEIEEGAVNALEMVGRTHQHQNCKFEMQRNESLGVKKGMWKCQSARVVEASKGDMDTEPNLNNMSQSLTWSQNGDAKNLSSSAASKKKKQRTYSASANDISIIHFDDS